MIDKDLQALGLNEKEAKVYIASLELGQATVQNIAAKADIKRPTTYFIIESLMDRGLMSSFYQGKRQYFLAETPERIADVIDKEISDLEIRKESFKRLLPQLQSINNRDKTKPVVKYYEGKDGVLKMVEEHIERSRGQKSFMAYSKDIVNNFASQNELTSIRNKRLGKNIAVKTIYTYSQGDVSETPNSERVRLSSQDFPITCDIAVYEDKLRIASLQDRVIGVVIEDKEIAKSFQSIFELAWKWAQHLKKEGK